MKRAVNSGSSLFLPFNTISLFPIPKTCMCFEIHPKKPNAFLEVDSVIDEALNPVVITVPSFFFFDQLLAAVSYWVTVPVRTWNISSFHWLTHSNDCEQDSS